MFRPLARWPFRAACLGLALLLTADCSLSAAQQRSRAPARRPRDLPQFKAQHAALQARFAAALDEIAAECDGKGLPEAAAEVRDLGTSVDPAELRSATLPREVQPAPAADLPADERQWRTQLRRQRQSYAKELYLLSRKALNSGHVSFALDLVRETAHHDPDHATARRILGFVRNGDEWLSAFESKMREKKFVWHDVYGWLPRDHVARYEAGERYYRNRWISAAKEEEERRDFSRAWEVRTEHYIVKTNHSLERGVQLARKLEDYHGLFYQLMAGFFSSPEQTKKLFAASASPLGATPRQHVVHFYREKSEYLTALKAETDQPAEITRGMYFPRNGIAFFFYDPEFDDDSTLYHEATHQLLSGSRPQAGEVGLKSNFWIVEGIACYMESFRAVDGRFSVGDPRHGRIQSARAHFLQESYYVPLEEFTRMGMQAFQTSQQIRKNYSQGAALTHFFLHYDDGRYREALIEHLSQIYSPERHIRESPESLEELTGVPAADLDQQYAEYLRDLGQRVVQEAGGVGE